jgi:nitrogen fixation protein NifQ
LPPPPKPEQAMGTSLATPSVAVGALDRELIAQRIAAVMRHAQCGELPLFAWTLGLSHDEWLRMVRTLFPELVSLTPPTSHEYAILRRGQPAAFKALVRLLLDGQALSPGTPRKRERVWLAHAIASASQGGQRLWQDLGLRRREDLGVLLAQHFPRLHERHARQGHSVHWKKFLYTELALHLQQPGLQPPGCASCTKFRLCFPSL